MSNNSELRVLIIDDSAYNRRALTQFLTGVPGVKVVGKAADGEEGLKLALVEKPDVITLDLEMPRMDGFTFLRILMVKQPTPVVVISSHTARENVFRALELGAYDFVAKPTSRPSPEIEAIRDEVVRKVLLVRQLKSSPKPLAASLNIESSNPSRGGTLTTIIPIPSFEKAAAPQRVPAKRLVVIGASTGGPAAITRVLTDLPADLDGAIAIAQHMPPRFTTTFAERLNKVSRVKVKEVGVTELMRNGCVYLAPGDGCIETSLDKRGILVKSTPPTGEERYVPSVDRLFHSAATVGAERMLAVVLTGMGDDGSRGVVDIARVGGRVLAEAETTAVIPGMPMSAVNTGVVDKVVPLERIADFIVHFCRR